MKRLFLLCYLMTSLTYSQITSLTDTGFEEDLLFQNIDSDGIINGQVLTSDISGLTSFSFTGFFYVTNIDGINDFSELQSLDLSSTNIGEDELVFETELDFSENTKLETLTLLGGNDNIDNSIVKIDLSTNKFITDVILPGNWLLKQLDLNSGQVDVTNLNINIDIDTGFNQIAENPNSFYSDEEFCIKVTDASAATAGLGVYSTWTVTADNNPYYFSETCTLTTHRFDKNSITVYPNPSIHEVFISSSQLEIKNVSVYSTNGQLVIQPSKLKNDAINVGALNNGVYILKIETSNGIIKRKLVKI